MDWIGDDAKWCHNFMMIFGDKDWGPFGCSQETIVFLILFLISNFIPLRMFWARANASHFWFIFHVATKQGRISQIAQKYLLSKTNGSLVCNCFGDHILHGSSYCNRYFGLMMYAVKAHYLFCWSFQVSLLHLADITEKGVTFQVPLKEKRYRQSLWCGSCWNAMVY